jgi:hypothetical protein
MMMVVTVAVLRRRDIDRLERGDDAAGERRGEESGDQEE